MLRSKRGEGHAGRPHLQFAPQGLAALVTLDGVYLLGDFNFFRMISKMRKKNARSISSDGGTSV